MWDIFGITPKFAYIKQQLYAIISTLNSIKKGVNQIMATVAELQTAAQTLAADFKTLKAGIEAFIAKNPNNSAELQSVLDSLTATDADVKTTDAEVEPGPANPIAGTTAPPA